MHITPLPHSGKWRVVVGFYWAMVGGELYLVPPQAETDLASIPRLFRVFLNPANPKYAKAAVLHDQMVKDPSITPAVSSREFLRCLLLHGVHPIVAKIMAISVYFWAKLNKRKSDITK